ncbi:MAG TPA: galactokinase family protein [Thermoguttaceae bacterium]|nr:galactokinase family protein [Thermoguttaceae bacterium]
MIQRLDYQGDLTNLRQLADALARTGLESKACWRVAERFAKAAAAQSKSEECTRARPLRAYFVPGRIEVLGKHTDYAGGRSMIVAVEQGFCLVAVARDDPRVIVVDAESEETVSFDLAAGIAPRKGHWSNYPMTVARRIARNFPEARSGAEIAFSSDLPPAAGMSSSSTMIVAVFLALSDVNVLMASVPYRENIHDSTALAGYLGTVENGQTFGSLEGDRGVGTFGGSEDHTAILCARPNEVSQYAYCPVRFERAIPMPEGCTFAIGTCGVVAEKTGAAMDKYNAASRLASAIAELWRSETGRDDPHLAAVLASAPDAANRLRNVVATAGEEFPEPEALHNRLRHFLVENEEILPAAGDALARGDVTGFGQLVDRSQQAAEELLGNQIPQTCFLAKSARQCGAAAASAFGAGFGGSVWALIEKSQTEPFLAAWAEAYRAKFPEDAEAASFFATTAGPAAFQVC